MKIYFYLTTVLILLCFLIAGCDSDLLTVKEYESVEDLHKKIKNYFEGSDKKSDSKGIRFSIRK